MPKFDTQGNSYLVAIVFFPENKTKKYRHNIKDTPRYRQRFKNFIIDKHGTALYINYYHKHNETFSDRVYIKSWNKELKQWV